MPNLIIASRLTFPRAGCVFICALGSRADWLDGFVGRRWKLEWILGTFMDARPEWSHARADHRHTRIHNHWADRS
jgi:hypothetical protein